ncbi:hypothetical protein M407DRAFT_29871 [Tulasnella calospora MUT 4182]|uniref:Extracellular membrane protein CFEM domain-containing protein n=1 Tax=Tulasnella calospora MUT 4182 TaxID=1051891 RepID=A0A0C3Q9B7_9AGAM|nr:hypothetical protein M407DRAFT_29871 [Tulasnella calospora MUT 4182]
MQLSAVLSFVAFVASASAVAIPNNTVVSSLTKRQTDACALFCDPLTTASTNCGTDATCICSGPVAALMYTCGTCGYQHDPTNYAQLQQLLDQYSAGCASANVPVGALPIPACAATTASS